ncbi:MAG: hypothetical protein LJE83_11575, partial [Gammaproteobacteria bacterium]|nr:hypothetical protein [Gammaproteobacteria bacterium]
MKTKIRYILLSAIISQAVPANAITIDVGPVWSAPGSGTEATIGSPDVNTGIDITYTGVDTGQ